MYACLQYTITTLKLDNFAMAAPYQYKRHSHSKIVEFQRGNHVLKTYIHTCMYTCMYTFMCMFGDHTHTRHVL